MSLFFPLGLRAQEYSTALPGSNVRQSKHYTAQKTTSLSLPFFDDFTDNSAAPNSSLWQDHQVYLSNTMSGNQFSRGFAVFDANNFHNVPYDSINSFHRIWADSLTSGIIDLSSQSPADSLWLSFYYEAQGNGYLPKPEDSLILYFYNSSGKWVSVWHTGGDTVPQFKQIMIPVKDSGYFHNQFAFRFVNRATHGISNSNWNLDYVFLNANRTYQDTSRQDIAYTQNSSNLLSDFTAMPYNQFKTNPSRFLANSIHGHLKNNGNTNVTINYGFQAKELLSGTNFSGGNNALSFSSGQQQEIDFPMFQFANFNPPTTSNGKVMIQTKYYAQSIYTGESKANDSIIQTQDFGNYFAYDDGSAEKAYFLHVAPNAPGTTAIEYALYAPDTIRGVAIYFPRTVPPSNNKEFSLIVYKNIAINGNSADQIVYQQDYYLPEFQDSVNKLHTYRFDNPVAMDTGVYYIGLMQSAGGFSDSLYVGLDVNRIGGNHRYFNVDGIWHPSELAGALMLRPIVGAALPPTSIKNITKETNRDWSLFPNPASDKITFSLLSNSFIPKNYQIIDINGRILKSGVLKDGLPISLSSLSSGLYLFQVIDQNADFSQKKFIRR